MKTAEVIDFGVYSAPTCSVHLHQHRGMLSFQGPTPRTIILLVPQLWQARHVTVLLISFKHTVHI